ncbi:hypothetical protein J6590_056614 [Homalodisca vitripennis]|nr:hypothetical protein J6590_056614 [Homalodisca vitripennis]
MKKHEVLHRLLATAGIKSSFRNERGRWALLLKASPLNPRVHSTDDSAIRRSGVSVLRNSKNLEAVVDFYPGEWLRERSPVCGKWVYIRLVSESYFSFISMGFFVAIGFDLSKTEYETSKTVPEYKVTYVVSGVVLFFVFGAFT